MRRFGAGGSADVAPTPDVAASLKPIDSWWTVAFIDPIALRALPWLLRISWLSANVVTGFAFVVGVVSVAEFSLGHWVSGAVLYEIRFFLDCLDGKIARLRRTSSAFGTAMDRLADSLTVPAAFAAIGWTLAVSAGIRPELAFLTALMSAVVTGVELSLDLVRSRSPGREGTPLVPGRLVGWARRHRLTLRPWTVEVETIGLFLGPLVLRGEALGGLLLSLAAVYAVFVAVDLRFLADTTRQQDRFRRAG